MENAISVLLADDHAVVRESLAQRLSEFDNIHVTAVVGSAEDAVAKAVELRPRVVLLDIEMPGRYAFDAAATIMKRCPESRVIFLSAFLTDHYVDEALAVGASGYVTKTRSTADLVQAIRTVASGAAHFAPEVEARIVIGPSGPVLGIERRSRRSAVGSREVAILRCLVQGLSSKEMSEVLDMSVRTIDNKISQMISRLGVRNRMELVRYAIREGIAPA